MTVGQLLRSISSRELAEWRAFDALEPIDAAEWQRAILAAKYHNAHVNDESAVKQPIEFMLTAEKPEQQTQSPDEMRRILESI